YGYNFDFRRDFCVSFCWILLRYFPNAFNGPCRVIFCGDNNEASKARPSMTKATVDAPRVTDVTTAPVFLPEALARALPDCKNNQHKVKVRLETLQREGDIRLLANGVPMAPGATPTMLGVEADTLHGRPILYIDVR